MQKEKKVLCKSELFANLSYKEKMKKQTRLQSRKMTFKVDDIVAIKIHKADRVTKINYMIIC
jgi:hypothetical protein